MVQLEKKENFYVCPPLGYVEQSLKILEEAKVAATVVVPNWVGKPWHLWLRERAIHVEVLDKEAACISAAMGVCGFCIGFQGGEQQCGQGSGACGQMEGHTRGNSATVEVGYGEVAFSGSGTEK